MSDHPEKGFLLCVPPEVSPFSPSLFELGREWHTVKIVKPDFGLDLKKKKT